MRRSRSTSLAIRPLIFMVKDPEDVDGGGEDGGVEDFPVEGWADLKDAPIELDAEDGMLCRPCGDDEEVVQDDLGQGHLKARKLPSPKAPSIEAVRKHNLNT